MKRYLPSLAFTSICATLLSCQQLTNQEGKSANDAYTATLDQQMAAHIFALPTHCLTVEYPNKLGQTIGAASDLKTPKALRPIFYGCFDWHSSVHGYWSIVTLMQRFPDLDKSGAVRAILNSHITPEHVAVEMAFFNDVNNTSFERTYGWAWLFKLQESLYTWKDTDAQRWKTALQPLVSLLVERYKAYLPNLVYPIRNGQHINSAFGLSLSLDYARTVGDKDFEEAIITHGKRLFEKDVNCDLAYEPSGIDFLSPCLEEAYLMAKILDANDYQDWLHKFLPNIYASNFSLAPAIVKDRSDGHLVHLDGLNYSRAACLYGIASTSPKLYHLRKLAKAHIDFSLPNLSTQDDYMGSHWLGTFALYGISKGE